MAKHIINNPGGRKPLPDDEVLKYSVTVRFTEKQMKRINRKRGTMPIRPFIRDAVIKCVVRPPISKAEMKEIRDLNNLGTNVNYLAKEAHSRGLDKIAGLCEEAAKGICKVLHDARLKIKAKEEEDKSLLQG